jgi:phospholipid N-methyltransferase
VRREPKTVNILQEFVADWRVTGALVPTSPFARNALLDVIDFSTVRVAVELGPGTGAITEGMLERLAPDATLVAIEINAGFVSTLRERIRDPRLKVVEGSAADVDQIVSSLGLGHADCMVSALPFANLGEELRQAIMRAARATLHPGSPLVCLQYTPLYMPSLMAKHFGHYKSRLCLWNVPPAFIYRASTQA